MRERRHGNADGTQGEIVHDAVARLRAQGVRAEGAVADVTTETGRAVSLRDSLTLLGGLDIVVNNAVECGPVAWRRLPRKTSLKWSG